MLEFNEKIDLIRNDPTVSATTVSASILNAFEPAVKIYAKLRKTVDAPPDFFQDGPFRKAATECLKHARTLLLPSSAQTSTMQSLSVSILFEHTDKVNKCVENLKRFIGGCAQKGQSWKDGLQEDCSTDVLEERFNSTLSKCKGKEIKNDSADLQSAIEAANVHMALMARLDIELASRESVQCKEAMQNATLALNRGRATKLEYWICSTHFSTKDALDKRDISLKYSTDFDAPPAVEGGRKAWVHDTVIKLEIGMRDSTGAADEKKEQQKHDGKKRRKG